MHAILSNLLGSRMANADIANSAGGLAHPMRERAICPIPVPQAHSGTALQLETNTVPDRKVRQAASDAASRSISRDRAVQESRIRSATLVVPRKGEPP
jgi:hypothetical protein